MNKSIYLFCISLISLCASGQNSSNENNFWESGLENSTGHLKMIRLRPINPDSLNYKSIIGFLNGKNSSPTDNNYIVFKKISKDTLYIKINNTTYLTQRIGTTGAMLYLAKVTYNLTELKDIIYVNMDFEEGDHASPGIFSRGSFANK